MGKGEAASTSSARIAFILFTDIFQSTRLWERFPQDFGEALERHNTTVEETVLSHSGEIMKNLGDGYIAIFNTADECVRSGVEIQKKLRAVHALPDGSDMLVRVVAHSGPLRRLAAGRGYFGEPLNRVSRICQVCQPGQLLVSQAVMTLIHRLPESTYVSDLGTHHLRDLAEPEQLYQLDHPDFALHEFPPLPTLNFRPNNLVAQPNVFIGRERELAELKGIVARDKHRLVTIVAPGGYGKSRLATQLCANLLDNFENGVFEVLLAPISEHERIVSMAAGALGFQFHGRGEPGQQFLDYLREKQMLILFDNFEHVVEGRALLLEILKRAPKVSMLVTSRESLRLTGEKTYWLDPLLVHDDGKALGDELPDGVALFAERASLVKHDFEITAESLTLVQTICEKLDGVPLAIELAAAWSDFYPLPQILKSVERQLDITARTVDVPERHRSVRACLDHSYKLLNDEQAQALRALAVFAGSFSLEAATQVLAMPETPGLLSDLHTKSWVYACPRGGEARFCMREAQREYADEQLAEDENRNTYLDRHAEYFAQFVEMKCEELVGPSQLEAVTAINTDLPNVYAAVEFSIDERSLRLLAYFSKHLRCYFEYVSRYMQGEECYLKMQAVLEQLSDEDELKRVRMYIHLGLGIFLWRLGKAKEAQVEFSSTRKLAEELLDASALAQSVSAIANFNIRGGKYTEAEELHREAIELWHKHGEVSGLSHSYSGLGAALFFQGRLDEAEECYRTSLSMARDSGDLRGISRALNNLGLLLSRRGGLDEANSLFQESIKISRQIGATDIISIALNNLGNIALNENDLKNARKWYTESLNFSREIGHLYEATGALNNLGELCCKEGKHEEAREYILQSLTLAEDLAEPIVRVEAVIQAAFLLNFTGEKARAHSLLKHALHAADSLGVAVNPHSREAANALLSEMSKDETTPVTLPEVTPAYLTEIVREASRFVQPRR